MNNKTFFTTAFYEDPNLTLNVLNDLIEQELTTDMDMYESGTFLHMAVCDNDASRLLLAKVISDFDAYKKHNDENFTCKCSGCSIELCALHDEHESFFRNHDGFKEIKYDKNEGMFVFEENMIVDVD